MGRYRDQTDNPILPNPKGHITPHEDHAEASSSSSTGKKVGLPELDLLQMRRQTSSLLKINQTPIQSNPD
jgi:hypothetical protein